ncbi:glutathione peroxidase [Methylomonas albis]|uniref:Glutathione peroxidase n=1 Tax=Methylomonas albis TaxID=1854563 RepID=A0ABR9CY96_9GAMM|nr:redoxin domain-containing protein [Methylomonas albis]MBD9355491.1 redoxin domain-containing protein [Methylomonas albis]
MIKTAFLIASLWACSVSVAAADPCSGLLNFKMPKLRSSEQIDFCQAFQGKVILAVNTASNCGYTPQFKGLEALYQKYKDQGLVVVGFPSNDFNQEFAEAEKTANVCYINYGVTFPMLEKSQVKGATANGFFQKLSKATGVTPAWNFHKYLIDRNGTSVTAFPSDVTPEQLDAKISALLSAK